MMLSAAVRAEDVLSPSSVPPSDERTLVRAAADGDARAFEQLVGSHHRRVFGFIYQMTRQRQDAEDLTQQTFIKAFHHLAGFDASRPMINWLLVIARRTALNHFRSARKWEEIPAEAAGSGPSPARQLEEQDRVANLWERARAVLSQREFEVIWLRFAEEMSTEETARIVGLTQTHVKVLVFRARRALLKGVQPS
jgi:RNA polymerase sigma-70 factor (ECF subfamily)